MKLTCIIVTKDRPDDLRRCLDSLQQQTEPADQVIVVASGQSVKALVQPYGYAYYQAEPGITRQRNIARQHVQADTDCVVYCDDDTELPADCFQLVRRNFSDHPEVVGLTGSLDQSTHHSWLKKLIGTITFTYTTKPYGFTTGMFNIINPLPKAMAVDWLPGAFMAYRWQTVKALAFDEWFSEYGLGEDFDFSYRASQLGKLWADPALVIQHHHSNLNRNWRKFGYMRIVNRAYLQAKFWPNSFKYTFGRWWANLWLVLFNGLRALLNRRYAQEWLGGWQGLLAKIAKK